MARLLSALMILASAAACSAGGEVRSSGGAGSVTTSTEETTADGVEDASEVVEDADHRAVAETINDLQRARAVADARWEGRLDLDFFENALELFESDQESAAGALDSLPPGLDGVDATTYGSFVTATEALASDAGAVAGRFRAAIAEDRPQLPSVVEELVGDHLDVVGEWTDACFALASGLATDELVDCVGLPVPLEGTLASDVVVSIECVTGDRMSQLPFDRTPFPFLQEPEVQDWMVSRVVIDNRSDDPVQLDPGFRVRYLDGDGNRIEELAWSEPVAVALWTPAESQLHRKGLQRAAFRSVPAVRPDDTTVEQYERILAETESCEVVDPVTVVVTEPDAYIEDVPVEIDDLSCERRDEDGRFYYTARVTNPTDEIRRIDLIVGFVDAEGTKLGQTGWFVDVPPGETVTASSSSVNYTIHRIDEVVDCRFFGIREL